MHSKIPNTAHPCESLHKVFAESRALPFTVLCSCPRSHPEHGEPAAGGERSSAQGGAAEAQGAAPEAAGRAGGAGAADEGAAGGQREQAEGAGDRAQGGSGSCRDCSPELGARGPTGLRAVELGISVLFRHMEQTPAEQLCLCQAPVLSRLVKNQPALWMVSADSRDQYFQLLLGFLFSFSVRYICQTWGFP